jgi:hypothetical protein
VSTLEAFFFGKPRCFMGASVCGAGASKQASREVRFESVACVHVLRQHESSSADNNFTANPNLTNEPIHPVCFDAKLSPKRLAGASDRPRAIFAGGCKCLHGCGVWMSRDVRYRCACIADEVGCQQGVCACRCSLLVCHNPRTPTLSISSARRRERLQDILVETRERERMAQGSSSSCE